MIASGSFKVHTGGEPIAEGVGGASVVASSVQELLDIERMTLCPSESGSTLASEGRCSLRDPDRRHLRGSCEGRLSLLAQVNSVDVLEEAMGVPHLSVLPSGYRSTSLSTLCRGPLAAFRTFCQMRELRESDLMSAACLLSIVVQA